MSKVMEGDGLREHGANVTTNLNARNWLRYLTFITVTFIIIVTYSKFTVIINCNFYCDGSSPMVGFRLYSEK